MRIKRSGLSPSRVSEAQCMWMQQPVTFGDTMEGDQTIGRGYARPGGGQGPANNVSYSGTVRSRYSHEREKGRDYEYSFGA